VARVYVDAENVRRSMWPNVSRERLLELSRQWAAENGHELVVVYDGQAPEEAPDAVGSGPETADDWLIRETAGVDGYWLVTSDRALRALAGEGAERVIGGGAFLRELLSGR
jgi:hypothetical protein